MSSKTVDADYKINIAQFIFTSKWQTNDTECTEKEEL